MRMWTVHGPERAGAARAAAADRIVVIKDGFAWIALFVPLLWLPFHRLWLWSLIYILAGVAIALVDMWLPVSDGAIAWLAIILNLWVAFDGNDARRRKLARRGFTEFGAVLGRSRREAEWQFFQHWARADTPPNGAPSGPPPRPPSWTPPPAPRSEPEVIGLFPQPEGGR